MKKLGLKPSKVREVGATPPPSLPFEKRVWGGFSVIHDAPGCKVKEIIINPHSGISYQRHHYRSEFWFVKEGEAVVRLSSADSSVNTVQPIGRHDTITVPVGWWHQLYTNEISCTLIEIQYGEQTTEDDIERLEYFDNGKAKSRPDSSNVNYQIELAKQSLAKIPAWLYSGKRIDGSSF